jgi:hypothetical protein
MKFRFIPRATRSLVILLTNQSSFIKINSKKCTTRSKILADLRDFDYFDVENRIQNVRMCLMEWCTDMPTHGLPVRKP